MVGVTSLRRQHDVAPRVLMHGEAYALMKFFSATGDVEWIWNGRDGVAPFVVAREGAALDVRDHVMRHTDFGEDVFVPNFVPPVGSRIFVSYADIDDATKASLVAAWAARIEEMGLPPRLAARRLRDAPFGMEAHSPVVVRVTPELRSQFAALAWSNPFRPPSWFEAFSPEFKPQA